MILQNTDETPVPKITWKKGNLLHRYFDGNNMTAYSYTGQGARFQKEVGNEIVIYYLDGSKLLWEKRGNL